MEAVGAPDGCESDGTSCAEPVVTIEMDEGDTENEVIPACGGCTVTDTVRVKLAAPKPPPDAAVAVMLIVLLPAASADTTPALFTLAMAGLELVYTIVACAAPAGCVALTVRDAVCPGNRVTVVGVTVSAVIAGGGAETVTATVRLNVAARNPVALALEAVATMLVLPTPTAVITPVGETLAISGLLDTNESEATGAPPG